MIKPFYNGCEAILFAQQNASGPFSVTVAGRTARKLERVEQKYARPPQEHHRPARPDLRAPAGDRLRRQGRRGPSRRTPSTSARTTSSWTPPRNEAGLSRRSFDPAEPL